MNKKHNDKSFFYQKQFLESINCMSDDALNSLIDDYRSQVSIGIMNPKDAQERILCITALLMRRSVNTIGKEICND